MTFICYTPRSFKPEARALIRQANEIIDDPENDGFTLSLRQLYYQFVARDVLPNTEKSYNRVKELVSAARLAGLISWEAIEDRTRQVRHYNAWDDPRQLLRACAEQFHLDRWRRQPAYCEVWVEKDALVEVVARATERHRVPYFSCRGYTSASELWGAAQRLGDQIASGKEVVVFHLGDHDPSGIDMTRDITERLALFIGTDIVDGRCKASSWIRSHVTCCEGYEDPADLIGDTLASGALRVQRLALNMDQVRQYDPPPNPAKMTDARASAYVAEFGESSWELDSLRPTVLVQLIESAITKLVDNDAWQAVVDNERAYRDELEELSDRYSK